MQLIEYMQYSQRSRELHRELKNQLKDIDLNPSEACALHVIGERTLSCKQLGLLLDTIPPRITTLVKELRYLGLVVVHKQGTTHNVTLTVDGLNKLKEMEAI